MSPKVYAYLTEGAPGVVLAEGLDPMYPLVYSTDPLVREDRMNLLKFLESSNCQVLLDSSSAHLAPHSALPPCSSDQPDSHLGGSR